MPSSLLESRAFSASRSITPSRGINISILPITALAEPVGKYKAGYQDVVFPQMPGRYDEQIAEFADIVCGVRDDPYSYDHELLLHECTLRACGYPLDGATENG